MLELTDLTTAYGDVTAVDGVSLTVDEGELFCLLGPSGSGKSTVLRTVAGFEAPSDGRVVLGGRDVTGTPPYDRDCSMVFQDWALFPNKTVLENVAFGPKMAGVDGSTRRERARESLEVVEMEGYEASLPDQLSGGQKQRVALARSLTVEPDLLLLDEPLSNLDRQLRETMQLELRRIHDRLGTTMLYVTHDQDEAFTLADRLGVMNEGELVQVGRPATVYDDPVDQFVESFLGSTNFLRCRVAAVGDRPRLETPLGVAFHAPIAPDGVTVGDELTVSLRPERLAVSPVGESTPGADAGRSRAAEPGGATPVEDGGEARSDDGADGDVSVAGTVTETVYRGADVRVRLTAGEATVFVERSVESGLDAAVDDDLWLRWAPGGALYFDESGARLR